MSEIQLPEAFLKLGEVLEQGQFEVYLQPKYRIEDNTLSGAEALIRWKIGREHV